jgi:hypothetical protein
MGHHGPTPLHPHDRPWPHHDFSWISNRKSYDQCVKDRHLLNLLGQYLKRCSERGGLYRDHNQSIALGSPLSPINSGLFLKKLDERGH